jgi:hypothetical protein
MVKAILARHWKLIFGKIKPGIKSEKRAVEWDKVASYHRKLFIDTRKPATK